MPGRPLGLDEGPLLALHLPVVVQQVALAGAVAAVAGVEAPRLVRMLNQHDVLLAWDAALAVGPDPATGA